MIRRRGLLAVAGGTALPSRFHAPDASGDVAGDAELIRLCAEHIENYEALNNDYSFLEDEYNPLWLNYRRTLVAINAAKPKTLAGMIAKARAAKVEARSPGLGESFQESGAACRWAGDLVNDLLRLHGAGV